MDDGWGELNVAWRTGGTWTGEEVDGEIMSGEYNDFLIQDGLWVLSYGSFGDLTLSTGAPGAWSRTAIRPGGRGPTTVVADGAGSWILADTGSIGEFELVKLDGSYDVIDKGYCAGVLRLDSAGTRHVVYEDGNFLEVEYAFHDGTDWSIMVVEEGGSLPTMVMDADTPVLVYQRWDRDEIHVARWNGSGFDISTVATGVGAIVTGINAAIDELGRLQIVWDSVGADTVYWAIDDGGTWVIEPVGTTSHGGGYPDLVVEGTTPVRLAAVSGSRNTKTAPGWMPALVSSQSVAVPGVARVRRGGAGVGGHELVPAASPPVASATRLRRPGDPDPVLRTRPVEHPDRSNPRYTRRLHAPAPRVQ